MKNIYIEVEGIIDGSYVIREICMDFNLYSSINNQGQYFQDKYNFYLVKDWKEFDKPFFERLSEILHEAELNVGEVANFIKMCLELKDYLFKFNYKDRMDFLIKMYGLFKKTYNEGGNSILNQISSALDGINLDKSSKYKMLKERLGSRK